MNDHPTESLSAYIDQELDAEERRRIDRHLLECETCAAMVADLMDMRSQVADFYVHLEAPHDLEQRVMLSIERTAKTSTITTTSSAAVPLVGVAALVVLLALYGSLFLKLFSIAMKFFLTVAFAASHVASSIPAVWGSILVLSIGIFVLSGLSIRRILQSTAS